MGCTTALTVLIAILKYITESTAIQTMDLDLVRVDMSSIKGYAENNLRVRKFNRTTHSLNGTWILLKDLDDSYEFSISCAYSSLGNNQFNEYPMKIQQKNLCQFLVGEYTEYQYLWADHTSLPQIANGTKKYCPFPKGEYWVKDVVPDSAWVPSVVPSGLWRIVATLWDKSNARAIDYHYYVKIEKKFIG